MQHQITTKMKKYTALILLSLMGCNTFKDVNTREIDSAIDMLDYSALYVDEEVMKGNIDFNAGTSLLENFLITKNYLLNTQKKMAKIMVNQLAHVRIQGEDKEFKQILIEARVTTEIRTILDDNGYEDFNIIDWELVTVDGVLIKER